MSDSTIFPDTIPGDLSGSDHLPITPQDTPIPPINPQLEKAIQKPLLSGMLAAISTGIVEGRPMLDLDYVEDSAAEVDFNLARTDSGGYVEIQGTGESTPFSRERLDQLITLADKGIDRLHLEQREILGSSVDDLIQQS